MIPDDPLTLQALGCRGVLRLCWRALYCQFCERASAPFLTAYRFAYERLLWRLIRHSSPQWAHDQTPYLMAFADRFPMWLLQFIHDLAYGDYYRRARLERDAVERQHADMERLGQ